MINYIKCDHWLLIYAKKIRIIFTSRNLSIDESVIAFKGRSTMKQFMPMKPIKRGFKVWACCCASQFQDLYKQM